MKSWNQLTKVQKAKALDLAWKDPLEGVLNGAISFNDKLNHEHLQARIDKAIKKADAMQTPWIAHEYLRDDKYVWSRLEGMARAAAEDSKYAVQGERVRNL